jgi:hypothetical protein
MLVEIHSGKPNLASALTQELLYLLSKIRGGGRKNNLKSLFTS